MKFPKAAPNSTSERWCFPPSTRAQAVPAASAVNPLPKRPQREPQGPGWFGAARAVEIIDRSQSVRRSSLPTPAGRHRDQIEVASDVGHVGEGACRVGRRVLDRPLRDPVVPVRRPDGRGSRGRNPGVRIVDRRLRCTAPARPARPVAAVLDLGAAPSRGRATGQHRQRRNDDQHLSDLLPVEHRLTDGTNVVPTRAAFASRKNHPPRQPLPFQSSATHYLAGSVRRRISSNQWKMKVTSVWLTTWSVEVSSRTNRCPSGATSNASDNPPGWR